MSRLVPIAPANNGLSHQAEPPPVMPYSCLACARRKVKCDKLAPVCSTCQKGKVQCEYQAPAPRKRRRKTTSDDDVLERLERYERLLKDHGLLSQAELRQTTDDNSTTKSSPAAQSQQLEITSESKTGKLLSARGKFRWIDNSLWRTLGEDELNPSSDEDEPEPGRHVPSTDYRSSQLDPVSAGIIGGLNFAPLDLLKYHPTYEDALRLWNTYIENVDPLVRMIHVPTGLQMVQRAAANPSSISKETECLLFAIYHFAVFSMTDEDCYSIFLRPRAMLQELYYDAVRQALINASFLRTTDFTVLQAFVLFLMSVRSTYDHNALWVLTGVAVRIAQRLGVHKDGTALGLKPFDVQLRARLFWQLLPLDGIASQICGVGISIGLDGWDTKPPLNVNDEDIHPEMTEPPTERRGATDMIFCLARSEVGRFQKESKMKLAPWASLSKTHIPDEAAMQMAFEAIDGLESTLESKYLRYCDFTEPLHCVAMAMGRGAVCAARFRTYLHRDKSYSQEERVKVSALAMKILEYNYAAQTNPLLRRYRWHLSAIFQWDPVVWVLNELRREKPTLEASKVWHTIERVFEAHPDFLTQKRSLHMAVGRMMLKAWASSHTPETSDPSFIVSMRALVSSNRNNKPQETSTAEPFVFPSVPAELPTNDMNNFVFQQPMLFDYNAMDDLSPDNLDWTFWDQLAQANLRA